VENRVLIAIARVPPQKSSKAENGNDQEQNDERGLKPHVTLAATEGNLATYHAGKHQANTGIIRRRKFCNAKETGRQSILKS